MNGVPPPRVVSGPRTPSVVGIVRGGRYRLTHVLGEGACGIVYGARDLELDRSVAIKELRRDAAHARLLLSHEARALACVTHPGIITLYASHLDGEIPFLVMEWFDGHPLSQLVGETWLTLDRALAVARQLASALDALHAAGFAHGDVKPANVLVDRAGRTKLVDIGLGGALDERVAARSGTPAYLSPERARGEQSGLASSGRADIYSFAVTCFQLLTTQLPFSASGESLVRAHAEQPPPRASDVSSLSRAFDDPLAWGLDKRADRRPPTCTALVDALDGVRRATDESGHPLRVLVVEDDDDQRRMIATAIASILRGAMVQSAPDGDAALSCLSLADVHVVVLDLCIPGPSGPTLVQAIREMAPRTAVVVLTGTGSGTELTQLRPLGVRHFLIKPAEPSEVVRAIGEAARSMRAGSARAGSAERRAP